MDENACGFAENEKTRRAAFSTLFRHLFSLKKASHEPRTRYSLHCMIIIFQQNWRKETRHGFSREGISRILSSFYVFSSRACLDREERFGFLGIERILSACKSRFRNFPWIGGRSIRGVGVIGRSIREMSMDFRG